MNLFTLAMTENKNRDKFISRFLGIFSENIARIYFSSPYSDYKDLGRPTINKKNMSDRGSTLDFTLENKKTKKIYICEMKCELEFEKYKYLELNDIRQIKHHNPAPKAGRAQSPRQQGSWRIILSNPYRGIAGRSFMGDPPRRARALRQLPGGPFVQIQRPAPIRQKQKIMRN
jgi:hypothetical protein